MLRRWTRGFASIGDFQQRAAAYWTSDRVSWLSRGRDDPLSPDKPGAAVLLRVLGLLHPDGTLGADNLRKYRQINAMFEAIERALATQLRQQHHSQAPLRLVDLCTGASSHLALLIAHASRRRWERPAHVVAVDASSTRIAAAEHRASLLGFGPDVLRYRRSVISELPSWPSLYTSCFPDVASSRELGSGGGGPHAVFALHACDTATDEAAAFAVGARAQTLLIAPCCQAELAAAWKAKAAAAREASAADACTHIGGGGFGPAGGLLGAPSLSEQQQLQTQHSFGVVHRMPNFRREMGATVTDALRVLLLKASGFSVDVSEFVRTEHTPKNRLITATRQRPGPSGRLPADAMRAREQAIVEYRTLRDATGGRGIALARLLGV
jgi:hypothetical protein